MGHSQPFLVHRGPKIEFSQRKVEKKGKSKNVKKKKKKHQKIKQEKKVTKNMKQFKNYEVSEDFQGLWFHTKNPRRFLGFVVCCCCQNFSTMSSTISMFFWNFCLFLERKPTTILGVSPFFFEKGQFFIGRVKKAHTLLKHIGVHVFFAQVSLSNNTFSFGTNNNSTTTTTRPT